MRHGGPPRQCVRRARSRADHHGACGRAHHRNGREAVRRKPAGRPALSAGRCRASMSSTVAVAPRGAWPLPLLDHYAGTARIWRNTPARRDREGFAQYLDSMSMKAGRPEPSAPKSCSPRVVADLIGDVRHVAVGNASPIPATAALLRARARPTAGPTCRCSAAAGTCSSPTAGANCSTAPARAASTCSSSPAARSTAKATSTWSASATTIIRGCAFPARSARRISITWCRR